MSQDATRRINQDEILAAFAVTREEIDALNNDRNYGNAHRQARAEREAFGENMAARLQEIAAQHGMTANIEPILGGRRFHGVTPDSEEKQ